MSSPDHTLRAFGLEPLTWSEVLLRVEQRLAPDEQAVFARLHRAFIAYPAEHTCRAFYDFAAERNLLDLLACHRFDRLTTLIARLDQDLSALNLPARARVLDFGAGGGFLANWMREKRLSSVFISDLSPISVNRLVVQGFNSPLESDRFDVIVCADSLGEIHADEDDWLSTPDNLDDDDFTGEMEARYGFAHKLKSLRNQLMPGGSILVYEPVPLDHFWRGAANLLEQAGYQVEIVGPTPTWGLRLTQPGVPPSPLGRGPG